MQTMELGAAELYAVGMAHFWSETPAMKEAMACFKRAAADGHAGGLRMVARSLMRGWDDVIDKAAAKLVYRRAADAGDVTCLAYCYYYGLGVTVDHARALELYMQALAAADDDGADNSSAICAAAFCLSSGVGAPADIVRGTDLYKRAVELGDPAAMQNLAVCYEQGEGVRRDPAIAVALYERGAARGDASCMFGLGYLYECGQGVRRNDTLAAEWYQRAADRGETDAIVNLGVLYERGAGVLRDYAIAAAHYQRASELGDSSAKRNLGLLYSKGHGVPKDWVRAVALFRQAIDKGDATGFAHSSLGWCFEQGEGVPAPDLSIAVEYYRAGAALGSSYAKQRLADRKFALFAYQEQARTHIDPCPPASEPVR